MTVQFVTGKQFPPAVSQKEQTHPAFFAILSVWSPRGFEEVPDERISVVEADTKRVLEPREKAEVTRSENRVGRTIAIPVPGRHLAGGLLQSWPQNEFKEPVGK